MLSTILNIDLWDATTGAIKKINNAISLLNSLGLGNGDAASVNNLLIPLGASVPYFGAVTAPNSSFLLANGQAISRTTYAALFALIGTNYGSGDGSTTFNIPNIKGRTLVGYDPSDSDYNALSSAKIGGESSHSLIASEMTAHFHTYNEAYIGGGGWVGGNSGAGFTYDLRSTNTGNVGSSAPHENRQPYITTNYIIRVL